MSYIERMNERNKYRLLSDDEFAAMTKLPAEYAPRLESMDARSTRIRRISTGAGVAIGLLSALPAGFNGWIVPGAVPFVIAFWSILGWIVGFIIGLATEKDLLPEWRDRYLADIGYESRVSIDEKKKAVDVENKGNDEGWDQRRGYPITGRFDPARYYSYSKSQRDYMRATGMDADTYDSNMPD